MTNEERSLIATNNRLVEMLDYQIDRAENLDIMLNKTKTQLQLKDVMIEHLQEQTKGNNHEKSM